MTVSRALFCLAVPALLIGGCGHKQTPSSMTEGHTTIGVSDAVYDFTRYLATAFETTYNGAAIDLRRDSDIHLVDSLLNQRADEIFLDRGLAKPESAAFQQANLKLYCYKIAYEPVFLLVPRTNPVIAIDSANLRGILSGAIRNWNQLGGPDQRLRLYLPQPGEGAWVSLLNYYGLNEVTAVACSTATAMLDTARGDAGALLAYSLPIDTLSGYKALRFRRDDVNIVPNYKTILDSVAYPFKLDITWVTTHQKEDVAAGFLTYISGNIGQRRIGGELKYRPAAIPVRFVKNPQQ